MCCCGKKMDKHSILEKTFAGDVYVSEVYMCDILQGNNDVSWAR